MTAPLFRRVLNRLLASMARVLPGATSVRPLLHRWRGVKIGANVFIGDEVYIENEYPGAVEIGDGAQICLRSTIIAHTRGIGKVMIGKNAFIGACCVLMAPAGKTLHIGEGAVIMAGCVVANDVAPATMVGSERPKPLAKATVPLTAETSYADFLRGIMPLDR